MKKFLSILLSLTLLCTLLAACAGKKPAGPLVICVDLSGVDSYDTRDVQAAFERFADGVRELGGPQEVEVEVLPSTGNERQAQIDRIRTEVAAGKGPDIFVVSAGHTDPLFRFPSTIMKQHYMLPLDEYIENAQFMEWDKLNQTVMELGRWEDQQVMIPLDYTFPTTLYRKSEVSHEPSADLTWEDVLADETGILQSGAADVPGTFFHHYYQDVTHVFGPLADYEKEELLFTEEELKARIMELMELNSRDYTQLPLHLRVGMGVIGNQEIGVTEIPGYAEKLHEDEALTMVPMYSTAGGITAIVDHYACINRNTRDPEGAFFLLDRLLDKEMQQYSDVYHYITEYVALPTYNALLSPEDPAFHWNWNEENYQEYCKLREQITCVRFQGLLENQIAELLLECAWGDPAETDVDALIHETYRLMEMELKES